MNKIYIVLLNYKTSALTLDCIESIRKSSYKAYQIVVVDNESSDKTASDFLGYTDVFLIRAQENLGFAGGCNIGINFALSHDADYIMLLNNDTIIEPDMLQKMIDSADDFTAIVPKMYYADPVGKKIIWYAGGEILAKRANGVHYGIHCIDNGQFDEKKYITFATGCCLMMSRVMIEQVGFLDENYFMYCEDTDLSLRILKAGWKILYLPEAVLWHKVSSSSGEDSRFITYYVIRNRLYLARKFKFGIKTSIFIHAETLYRWIKCYFGRYNKSYKIAPTAIIDFHIRRMGKQEHRF